MTRLKLKQLSTTDTINNQIIRYNNSTGLWESNSEAVSAPTVYNKGMFPDATSGDNANTGLTISKTPDGYYVNVKVNGISYEIGDGIKTKDCYFSDDSGSTAKNLSNIESEDSFFWNGNIAGFDLTTEDIINFEYNVTSDGGPGLDLYGLQLIEKKSITTLTQSVTFSNLNGESDEVYYLTFRFIGSGIYYLRPNATTSNLSSSYIEIPGATYNSDASNIVLTSSGTNIVGMGEGYFFAKNTTGSTNFDRVYVGKANQSNYSGNTSSGWKVTGHWNDDLTDITSLQIYASVANGIGVGSEITLYKLSQL